MFILVESPHTKDESLKRERNQGVGILGPNLRVAAGAGCWWNRKENSKHNKIGPLQYIRAVHYWAPILGAFTAAEIFSARARHCIP